LAKATTVVAALVIRFDRAIGIDAENEQNRESFGEMGHHGLSPEARKTPGQARIAISRGVVTQITFSYQISIFPVSKKMRGSWFPAAATGTAMDQRFIS
jgi:hypothetical protein